MSSATANATRFTRIAVEVNLPAARIVLNNPPLNVIDVAMMVGAAVLGHAYPAVTIRGVAEGGEGDPTGRDSGGDQHVDLLIAQRLVQIRG